MPRFFTEKRRLRKSTPLSGHEITMPSTWVKNLPPEADGQVLELLYDSILVVVPPGVRVNKKALAAAVEEDSDESD